MRVTKNSEILVPEQLRNESSVVVTKSMLPGVLMMFSRKSWIAFEKTLSRLAKGKETRAIRRHYYIPAVQLTIGRQKYIPLKDREELMNWFCDGPGTEYEIRYNEPCDCYLFTSAEIEEDPTGWTFP